MGKLMAEQSIGLVYGGGDLGLMGAIAHGVFENGGSVVGVIPKSLYKVVTKCLGETIVTDTMHERKMKIYELSDAFLALPGGLGTLDELFETLTWQQLGIHAKPVAVLNTEKFYDPMLTMIQGAKDTGFVGPEKRLNVFNVAADVIPGFQELLKQATPQSVVEWDAESKLKVI